VTTLTSRRTVSQRPAVTERRGGGGAMIGALHAEWTKVRTIAGPALLLLAAASLTAGLSWLAVAATTCPTQGCTVDATKLSLTGVQLGQAVIAVLAVLTVGTEYSTGMIRTTLTAMPHRILVLAAKATVLTAGVLVAGVAGVLGSVLAGRLVLPGQGFTAAHGYSLLSLTDGSTLRAAAGSVLYLALIALLSLGIATLVRDSAAAIGVVLGLLYLFPILLGVVTDTSWHRHLQQIAPSLAGLAIQNTIGLHDLPIGPWAGLGVLAAWATGALLAGGGLLMLRDA
jgi:ABC-2 type transport system permease protein